MTSGGASGAGATRARRWVRGALLGLIAGLYVASVPWYRGDASEVRLLFGLPEWVAVALCCYVAVAVLNCAAWLLTDLRDSPHPDEIQHAQLTPQDRKLGP